MVLRTVRRALAGVPESLFDGRALLHQSDVVVPGDSCKSLLHDCSFRPRGGEGAHVFQIAWRQSPHVRVGSAQVSRKPFDDPCAPACVLLAIQDQLATPIQYSKTIAAFAVSQAVRRYTRAAVSWNSLALSAAEYPAVRRLNEFHSTV